MPLRFMGILIACAAVTLSAQTRGADTTMPPPVERLERWATVVEAATLPFDSHAARLLVSITSEVSEEELRGPFINQAGTLTATSLGMMQGKLGIRAESFVKDVNAMRIFAFTTKPGERVTFRLKSERSRVRLAVYPDPKNTQMRAAIKKANLPPAAARSSKLVFTNTSKEPYDMLLFVYGLHGYSYRLTWDSSLKGPA